VGSMYQDLRDIVVDQEQTLDRIELNTSLSKNNTKQTVNELKKAKEYNAENRMRSCYMALVLVFVVFVTLMIIVDFWHN